MTPQLQNDSGAGASNPRRLFVYNGGFATQRRLRRILSLSGFTLRLGLPGPDDMVGVWGNSPTAHRGEAVAARRNTPILRIEDALIRSLLPGRLGEAPVGLLLDSKGVHFDASVPSDLEELLRNHPLDDTALLNRARDCIDRISTAHLTKYYATRIDLPLPDPGYVLVIDQTRGDAAVRASGANRSTFREMLVFAQEEHPGMRVLIKTHPETAQGLRKGYFGPEDCNDRISLITDPISPWQLFEGATGVYTVSSQMGFEAIFAGHKPRVFGQPFYAGWGLTQDERPVARRERKLTRAQLFAAAMLIYPKWYDPHTDQLCELESVLDSAEARARAWRDDHQGWIAGGMRMWKRKPLQSFFGTHKPVTFFEDDQKAPQGVPQMVWAGKADRWTDAARVEDGFLRSRGLGAELVPPLSLVLDDLGIYYDPSRESRLERLIATAPSLPEHAVRRAERLMSAVIQARLSKYNLALAKFPELPEGRRILVPGQVEDDASIKTGAGDVCTNLGLLMAARQANPDAVIIYKPHPDVEAGLRNGAVDADGVADVIASQADPIALIDAVDEVWTMTSLFGFEALIRGKAVTTLGAPFYAGWGLTTDMGHVPRRRRARPNLAQLVHAVLIGYPRYVDPVTGLPCSPEVAVARLNAGQVAHPGMANRLLSKLQGAFASKAHLWR